MTFNLMDIFSKLLEYLGTILVTFSDIKIQLEQVVVQVDNFDFLTIIRPFIATIRYISGDYIYIMIIRILQISLFIGLIYAAHELINQLINSPLIKKPIQLLKSFVGL